MFEAITNLFKKQPPAPVGEIAVSESALFTGSLFRTFNPDPLTRRKGGLPIYDEMRRDDEVKSALTLKKHAILAPGWTIEPATDSTEDQRIALFVEGVFDRMHGTIDKMLFKVMSAFDYGYSISEILYTPIEDGEFAGMVGLKAIKLKKPHFYEFAVDQYSNLLPDGLVQTILGGPKSLPTNKFLIYSHNDEWSNWYGTSDLLAAYRAWWSKNNIIKFWSMYLERFGMPLVWGQYNSSDPAAKTRFDTVLERIQSKTSITSKKGEFEIELLEATRKGASDYEKSLNFHNRSIARSLLIPDKLTTGGESGAGGSLAQAEVHFDVFLWVIAAERKNLEGTVMEEQLIRRLIGFNFQDVKAMPKFRFNPLTDDQKVELSKAFSDAVQKGSIIPTMNDSNHIRRTLSFEEADPDDEPLTKPELDDADIKLPKKEGKGKKGLPQKGNNPDESGEGKKKEMSFEEMAFEVGVPKNVINSLKDARCLAEKIVAQKAFVDRVKSRFEKNTSFGKIRKELNKQQEKHTDSMKGILTRQRDKLTGFIATKMQAGEMNHSFIRTGISLKFLDELKKEMQGLYVDSYRMGQTDARKELPKLFKSWDGLFIEPEEALNFLKSKADFDVAGIKEPLVRQTKNILIKSLQTGTSIPSVIQQLQDTYRPYLESGDILIDGKQIEAFRLEAIVRTAQSEAYNFGRRAIAESKDAEGFVLGYMYSEIIDDRTVPVSLFADGITIRVDDPLLASLSYPLHWNERGMFVFVTQDDVPVEWSDQSQLNQLAAMVSNTKP